jgi:LytS/YehU family sensor histidine kinase
MLRELREPYGILPSMIVREEGVLDLLVAALPHLRGGLRPESAGFTAQLLYDHLDLDAASVISTDRVLAFIGQGADHHIVGEPNLTALTRRALETGEVMRTQHHDEIGCPHPGCPLSSAVIAPLHVRNRVAGAVKLYRAAERSITAHDENVARGLARVLSVYLEMAELDERATLVTKAELEALRAQISPHFLFNTLTTIAALTRTNAEHAHTLILDLAEFFRDALAEHGELVSLEHELASVERYLRFETARYGDRLRVAYEIDPAARPAAIPVLAIQLLVQNAVTHGIAPSNRSGTISISARKHTDVFAIAVSDDGVGMPPEVLARVFDRGFGSGAGIGLDNVQRRVTALFGAQHRLRIFSEPDKGTTVSFTVPVQAAS